MSLNEQQQRFAEEYCVDFNATQAALRAGYAEGSAGQQGYDLLKNPQIAQYISTFRDKQAKNVGATVENVLKRLMDIATADPNELMEYRRVNCRHCYGIDFGYQRTDAEMRKARREFEKNADKSTLGMSVKERREYAVERDGMEFDPEGGTGFDRSRKPNPACPECNGEGESVPFAKDTRELSEKGRALLAGVKITAGGGVEIKTHDQLAALDKVARHLGMFVDRQILQNPDGSAVQMAPILFRPKKAKPDGE